MKIKRPAKIDYVDHDPSQEGVIPAVWSSRQRLPLGMMAAAVMIWAYATGNWMWGGVVGAGLEVLNFFWSRRMQIAFKTQRRAWLVTIVFLWWLGISAWLENTPTEAVRLVLSWAPMTLLPLVAVGIAGVRGGVPMTVFPYIFRARIRRHHRNGRNYQAPRFSPHLPFVASLLLGASYGWSRDVGDRWGFLVVSALMVTWVWVDESGRFRDLESGRAIRRRLPGFVVSMAMVLCFAFAASYGVQRLHEWAESGGFGWSASGGRNMTNRASVQLGDVGEIQLSQDVIWRLKTLQGIAPDRVCDGVFDLIRTSVWINRTQRQFTRMGDVIEGEYVVRGTWPLSPLQALGNSGGGKSPTEGGVIWRYEMYGQANDDFTVLPMPKSPLSVSELPAYEVERNGFGVVRATLAQPVIKAEVIAAPMRMPQLGALEPDLETDLDLGPRYEACFKPLADELGLQGMSDREKIAAVRAFFGDGFRYSLSERPDQVEEFVTTDRQGHCELFATATVLLLRAAGVPARYHTGFVVDEYDADDECYVLRGVHAHAWAEAWIDGSWRVVDTTPAGWLAMAGGDASWWQRVGDQLRLWLLDFRYWRSSLESSAWASYVLPWAVALVVVYIAIRVWLGRSQLLGGRSEESGRLVGGELGDHRDEPTGWDRLRPAVERAFGEIPAAQPVRHWVVTHPAIPDPLRARMIRLVRAHYRIRFAGHDSGEVESETAELVDGLTRELVAKPTGELANGRIKSS
ncbi:transglutaminase-like domain-containing protein [Sulfuriroseicoccus oceanibius]|uniref:Transglutaminase domain-containing protein n=1 Tax=Sulfuriroseicoccus oceanibius TaxID=2707525 RepID=A0A6B3L6R4_9BACT|nr:transglutaminase-like domain-containing protein [Sulfuriroseicoccus oceanibius]QQL45536.1 transglutaminase domain-containing protein [Sulfuriroseicoccus oceanibius]